MPEEKHIAVVGGGLLGMVLASELSKMGCRVTLIEKAQQLGGLAAPMNINGVVWDAFYHVVLSSDEYTRKLLKELELEEAIRWVETKTGFYSDTRLYSMSNTLEFLKFPPLTLLQKLRLGFTIFYASRIKNWEKLERHYVDDWLIKLSGKSTFNKMWLPLLRAKLGDLYKETSATFIWATIQRMYAARRSGLKMEMFGYVKGGYRTIIDVFTKKLQNEGIELRIGASIAQLTSKNKSQIEVSLQDGQTRDFDRVVLTVPSAFVPTICPEISSQEKELHKDIRYMGVVCVSVILKQALSDYYVTNITDSNLPFTGVIEMSALVDNSEFHGNHLVYLPKYLASDDPVFNTKDEEITVEFLSALRRMHPRLKESDILSSQVAKARYVFALPGIAYSRKLPPWKSGLKNVFILNNAHIVNGTLNVNETIKLAKEHAREIIHKK